VKAWELKKNNTVLEIIDIDDDSRQVRRVLPLRLTNPMTLSEARGYVDAHFPKDKST
jgi:hypothetical protein